MKKVEVSIRKDQLCAICGERLVNPDGTFVTSINMKSDLIGLAHDPCFFPFYSEEKLKVLIKVRCYSMGDVIAATPIVREVRRIYPKVKICVLTLYPDLFKYNPHIDEILDMNRIVYDDMRKDYLFEIDAFNSERGGHFAVHSVQFSAISALNRGLAVADSDYEVRFADENTINAIGLLEKNGIKYDDKVIAINPHGTEWKTRDWGRKHMQALVDKIKSEYPDHKIISVGGKRAEVPTNIMDNYVHIDGVIDLFGKLSLLDSIALFNLKNDGGGHFLKLLITPDTGTLHLGACSPDLPMVGIFTLIKAEFRTPIRNGVLGHKFIGINADNPCNCTYDSRFLTDEAFFGECPKLAFLKRVKEVKAPWKFKTDGLNNYREENWSIGMLDSEIDSYNDLKCFPTVDKVFKAVKEMLELPNKV